MQTGFYLYMYLFYAPYKVFCFMPLLFYVQTLIIKLFYEIEECLVAKLQLVSNCCHFGWYSVCAGDIRRVGIVRVGMVPVFRLGRFRKEMVVMVSVRKQFEFRRRSISRQLPCIGTVTYRFQPLRNMFNCFGTGCSIDFSVRITKGVQVVSLLLFLLSIVLVYFIHEPEFGARWRRFLWGKCVKGFHYYTICFSRGARRVSQIESKTNASNSNRFTDLV